MSDTITTTTVPIQETPLAEVRTEAEFEAALTRIIKDEIPGFVIRAAGLVDSGVYGHEGLSEVTIDTLNKVAPRKGSVTYARTYTTQIYSSYRKGIGRLHHDGAINNAKETVDVHTTTEGGGKVLLAESGPDHSFNSNDAEFDDRLAESISRGVTDPSLMSPTVHTAELGTGDTVVMPLVNNKGPIIHRFDKSSPTRKAEASLIRPVLISSLDKK